MTDERVAIVTGGGNGIGRAIVTQLAASGYAVGVIDLAVDRAAEVVAEIEAGGGRGLAVAGDVGNRADVESAFAAIEEALGPVDVMVNNAGISINRGVRGITDEDWGKTIHVNLTAVALCSQAAARSMVPRKSGRIVNISSRAWLGWWGQLPYAASKGGVVSATRTLAIELAAHGITVNCIAPGLIETQMLRQEPQEMIDKLIAAQPTGTIGTPEDVARAVEFFARPTSRGITGQVLYVCGGKSLYAQPQR